MLMRLRHLKAVAPDQPGRRQLAIDRLVVRYGRNTAVDGLTLQVPRGSVFGLLRANGADKTPTIKMLLGFRKSTSGDARIQGRDIVRDRIESNAHPARK
jgi:ABC-2 type transport system ATP-binding protein